MSYSDIQTFKSRFWKHVWELDPESLSDLLKEGNPVGHVNFKFRVPSNHGYDFIPAYEGMYDEKTHRDQNVAIDDYLECHDKTAVEILWPMLLRIETSGLVLPSGARIDDDNYTAVTETLVVLWRNGAWDKLWRNGAWDNYSKSWNSYLKSWKWNDENVFVNVKDLCGIALINILGHPDTEQELLIEEWFKLSCSVGPVHYKLMLLLHPRHFNRLLDTFPLKNMDDLFDWCISDVDITKKLWKFRLVNLDGNKWPTINDFDDISVDELKAMYEGHPLIVALEQDEAPAKKKQKVIQLH